MDTQMYGNQTAIQEEINSAFIGAMSRVYLYMTGGLVLTTIVAMVVALNPDIQPPCQQRHYSFRTDRRPVGPGIANLSDDQ